MTVRVQAENFDLAGELAGFGLKSRFPSTADGKPDCDLHGPARAARAGDRLGHGLAAL